MALKTRVNNASTLNLSSAWSPATVPGATDQLYWNGVTGTNATVAMGGFINIGGTGGGIALGSSQTTNVVINNATLTTVSLGTLGIDLSASAADLTFGSNGTVYFANALTPVNVAAGRTVTIGSVSVAATTGPNKTGAGTLVLNTATAWDSVASVVTLTAGTIQVGSITSLGQANGKLVLNGGTLCATGTSAIVLNIAFSTTSTMGGTITLGDSVKTGALTIPIMTLTANANLTVLSTITLGPAGSTNAGGAFALSKAGAGTLIIPSINFSSGTGLTISGGVVSMSGTFTGANAFITINGGTFQWSGITTDLSAKFLFAGPSGLDTNGNDVVFATARTGTGPVTKLGAGTLTFGSATGNTYTGGTTVAAGTLKLGVLNGVPTSGYLTIGSTGNAAVFDLAGFNQSCGGLLTAGTAASQVIGNSSTTTNSTLTISGTAGTSTYAGVIQNTIGAGTRTVALVFSGGTSTLSGANTFTGSVQVTAGTLNANSITALGAANSTAAISVASGTTLSLGAALNYSSPGRSTSISGVGVTGVEAGCLVLSHAGPINLGSINATNNTYIRGTTTTQLTSAIAWSGAGGLRLGAATGTTATFSGAISVSSGTLTAILFGRSNNPDLGTVVLGTTNTFGAPAQIDFGTLQISADANLGTAPGAATAAYLIVGGSTTLATTATFTLNANRGIALGPSSGSGTGTINVASATTLTYAGVVANNSAGTGKLIKSGTGTLKLTGTNTYSGGSDLGAGTTQAGNTQALGTSGTVTLTASGATLQTLTTGGQNGKLTVASLNNAAGGIIKIGG